MLQYVNGRKVVMWCRRAVQGLGDRVSWDWLWTERGHERCTMGWIGPHLI